jgi:RNase P subunit RPR2
MKVIEYGRKRVRCQSCLSLLEYERSDVNCREGNTNSKKCYFIVCPVCGKQIPVITPIRMTDTAKLNEDEGRN